MGHVTEQRNLLWGSEVTAHLPERGRRPARVVHVEDEHVGFATALALVVEHGRHASNRVGIPRTSRCPRCGHAGDTVRDFGTRMLGGKRRPQSWCRACRASHLESPRPAPSAPEPGWLF
jgi:hypothetical protein